MHPFLLSCVCLPLLLAGTGMAQAQSIQRCSNAAGQTVFTDKACELVQARPRLGTPTAARGNRPGTERNDRPIDPQRQCPQRLSQLVEHIQQAIGGKDSNRLAAVYWWAGQDNAAAARVLDRLEAMVQRPLVDIAPVYPAARPEPVAPASAVSALETARPGAMATASTPPADTAPAQAHHSRPRPYGLRIEQTLANGATRASNTVHLRRQYGCFWISF